MIIGIEEWRRRSSNNVLFIALVILTSVFHCAHNAPFAPGSDQTESCEKGQFYAEHIPGCTDCTTFESCGDQDIRDQDRCRNACRTEGKFFKKFQNAVPR